MSRAFTSEEYEAREIVIEKPTKIEITDDHELVLSYSQGRNISDPSLPYEIGIRFRDGSDGFFKSQEFAVKWLSNAVKMNNIDAMLALADIYLSDTKSYGYGEPAKLLKKASDLGSAEATSRLDPASVTNEKSRTAFTVYRLNAELGDIACMLKLAEGFEKEYFGKDKSKAAALWYMRAFERGDKDAAKKVLALYYKKKIQLSEEQLRILRS